MDNALVRKFVIGDEVDVDFVRDGCVSRNSYDKVISEIERRGKNIGHHRCLISGVVVETSSASRRINLYSENEINMEYVSTILGLR